MNNRTEASPTENVEPVMLSAEANDMPVKWQTARAVGHRAMRGAAAMGVGGIFALGVNNLYGSHSDVGPTHIVTHIKYGSSIGITSDAADLSLHHDSPVPIGFYVDVEGTVNDGIDPRVLVKETGLAGDPAAVAEQLVSDYIRQAELVGGIGALASVGLLGFRDWVQKDERRKNSFRRTAYNSTVAATILGAGAIAGYLPTRSFDNVDWTRTTVSVGNDTFDISYGGAGATYAANEITNNEKYYNTVRDNVKNALIPVAAEDAKEHSDEKKITVYSDWHCNYGMARSIAQINKSLDIKATINAGDTFLGGTSAEAICADVLANNLKGTKNYIAPGNHDPNDLLDHMKKDDFTILDGKPVVIEGATVLGFKDPTISPAYVNTLVLRDPHYSPEQFESDVIKKTCDVRPNILVDHEPQETPDAAHDCAELTVNGHTHVKTEPEPTGPYSVTVNDGTIGGAASERQSVGGSLGKEASCYVIYIRKGGKPVGARTITVQPNKHVSVSDYKALLVNSTAK